MNWRGRPLISYETGITITNEHFKSLPLQRHEFHGDWNYTMKPEQHQLLIIRP
jgi:hypothetical protein